MKKQTSIFLVILLCMLVAVAAGGTSYLVLANAHDQETQSLNDQIDRLETQVAKLQKEAKSATTAKTTTTPTTTENTATATTTTDPTADWQTYTGKYEIQSIKYPSTWRLEIKSNSGDTYYKGNNWKGPFEEFTLTSPKGFRLTYTSHIEGIGGGCNMGVDCNQLHYYNVQTLDKANYKNLYLIQLETKDHADKNILNRKVFLWNPSLPNEKIPTTGSKIEGINFSVFPSIGVDESTSAFSGTFAGDDNYFNLNTEQYFNLADVKEAVEILKTVKFK